MLAATHKVTQPPDLVILQYHVTSLNHFISTTTVPMVMKLGRMLTYLERLLNHKVTQHPDHVVLQFYMTNEGHYIPTTRVPVATKPGRMVAHLVGLLSIKSHNPLIT